MAFPTEEQIREAAEQGWSIFQLSKYYGCSAKNLQIAISANDLLYKQFQRNATQRQVRAREKAKASMGLRFRSVPPPRDMKPY